MKLPNGEKVQGMSNFATYLENNPEYYTELKEQVFELIGIA